MISKTMDSKPVRPSCCHANVRSELMRNIEKTNEEKEFLQERINYLSDQIEQIEKFVFYDEENIAEEIFSLIQPKSWDLMKERDEVYSEMMKVIEKIKRIQEKIEQLEDSCFCEKK